MTIVEPKSTRKKSFSNFNKFFQKKSEPRSLDATEEPGEPDARATGTASDDMLITSANLEANQQEWTMRFKQKEAQKKYVIQKHNLDILHRENGLLKSQLMAHGYRQPMLDFTKQLADWQQKASMLEGSLEDAQQQKRELEEKNNQLQSNYHEVVSKSPRQNNIARLHQSQSKVQSLEFRIDQLNQTIALIRTRLLTSENSKFTPEEFDSARYLADSQTKCAKLENILNGVVFDRNQLRADMTEAGKWKQNMIFDVQAKLKGVEDAMHSTKRKEAAKREALIQENSILTAKIATLSICGLPPVLNNAETATDPEKTVKPRVSNAETVTEAYIDSNAAKQLTGNASLKQDFLQANGIQKNLEQQIADVNSSHKSMTTLSEQQNIVHQCQIDDMQFELRSAALMHNQALDETILGRKNLLVLKQSYDALQAEHEAHVKDSTKEASNLKDSLEIMSENYEMMQQKGQTVDVLTKQTLSDRQELQQKDCELASAEAKLLSSKILHQNVTQDNIELHESIAGLVSKHAKALADLECLDPSISALQLQITNMNGYVSQLQNQIYETEKQNADESMARVSALSENETLLAQIALLTKENLAMQSELTQVQKMSDVNNLARQEQSNAANTRMSELQSSIDFAENDLDNANGKILELNQHSEATKVQYDKMEADCEGLSSRMSILEIQAADKNVIVSHLKQQIVEMSMIQSDLHTAENESFIEKISALSSEKSQIEAELAQLQATSQSNKIARQEQRDADNTKISKLQSAVEVVRKALDNANSTIAELNKDPVTTPSFETEAKIQELTGINQELERELKVSQESTMIAQTYDQANQTIVLPNMCSHELCGNEDALRIENERLVGAHEEQLQKLQDDLFAVKEENRILEKSVRGTAEDGAWW